MPRFMDFHEDLKLPQDAISVNRGVAERLPFADRAFDAALAQPGPVPHLRFSLVSTGSPVTERHNAAVLAQPFFDTNRPGE